MQVVGDDLQMIVVEQGAGNRFGGGADIDEQRGVIGDLGGDGFTDALFFIAHLVGAHCIGSVFDAGIVGCAAMVATQQIGFRELIDVAADGLRGNNEQRGHFLDADIAAFADQLEDLLLTGRQIHGASFGLPCKICP
ncbi:hypothetical protein D3C72_1575280 [compost metagenome]